MKKFYIDRAVLIIVLALAGATWVSAQPVFEWAVKWGGTDFDQSLTIAVDRHGNTYTAGFYNGGTASFGPHTVNATGSSDAVLAKCDPAGNFLWARNLGGDQNESGTKVAVDDKGNVYVAGGFSSTNFSPEGSTQAFTALGWNNVFVVKYDSGGNFRWAKSLGGTQGDYCEGLAVDDYGNVYLAGSFSSADFDPGSSANLLTPVGGADIFLVKLDSNGNYLWAQSMGGMDDDNGHGIALDGFGNIYMTGFFNGPANFDPNGTANLTVAGVSDIFLAKYDTAGNYQWARRIGGPDDDYGYEVATDRNGDVLLVGAFNGGVTFDGTTATVGTAGGRDAILVKYDSAGNYQWAKGIGGNNWDEGFGVATDGNNNVYVTGVFQDDVDFGAGTPVSSSGSGDIFVAKYDPAGNYIWAVNMGGSAFERGKGIGLDGSGNAYVTGHFMSSPADFNIGGANGQLTPGVADGFIVKFGCSDTTSAQVVFEECGASFTVNGIVYTTGGTYTQVFANTAGCDSILTIELTLNPVDTPVLTVDEHELGVVQTYDAYQWIDESGDIHGATNPTYSVTANGKYSVRTTDENGCVAVSAIYEVTNVSVQDAAGWARHIRIYPNPVHDMIYVSSPISVRLSLSSIDGRVLFRAADVEMVDMKKLTQGIYLLQVMDAEGRLIRTEKVLKQ